MLGGVFVLNAQPDHWRPPLAPVFGHEAQGVVYNRLTQERLGDVAFACGRFEADSDTKGRFVINFDSQGARRCRVHAQGFEPQDITVRSGDVLRIGLVPDPGRTLAHIVEWQRQRHFAKQYDLLHSDINRSWTREEFTRLLSLTEHEPIVEFRQADPYLLVKWDYYGDVYDRVAVVPTWITYDRAGERVQYYWEAHLVREDGLWRWFREPLTEVSTPGGDVNPKSIASDGEPH
jgi:hypothetical protein